MPPSAPRNGFGASPFHTPPGRQAPSWANPYARQPGQPGQPWGAPSNAPQWGAPSQGRPGPQMQPSPQQQFGQPQPFQAGGFDPRYRPGPNPGGPPFAPGQYPPAYPWPQPKKKSGSLWWLALPVVVLGLMMGYLVLTQSSKGPGNTGGGGTPGNDNEVVYVNEEYQVPGAGQGPSEVVDSYNDPSLLDSNEFYQQKVPEPVRCEAPDVANIRDADELEQRLQALSECLTRTFGPPLEAAGYEPYQPRVKVYEGNGGNSPCGELEPRNAFFCAANQGIYFSAELVDVIGDDQTVWDYVMAHEYGHNVQGRNGILVQRHYSMRDAKSKPQAFELNRRLEVQADCLAASFIQSVTVSLGYDSGDYRSVVKAAEFVGDPPDAEEPLHGVSASRGLWTERGLKASTYQECNTFVAPSSEVK